MTGSMQAWVGTRRVQFAAAAAWIVISGGTAVYRTLSADPIGVTGQKCIFPSNIGNVRVSNEDDKKLNPQLHTPGTNPFEALERGSMCEAASLQTILDLRLHPVATILGTLTPSIVLAPFAYWIAGFALRRHEARKPRFKVCEYCAEKIRFEAKLCRFCGQRTAKG